MKKYTHASIIPLIGGETIASERIFGSKPEYIMSYSVFKNNDNHILNHYGYKVPYHLLDNNTTPKTPYVDVVSSVCPCAGLSQLSTSFSEDNPSNKWMIKSTTYVLENVKPMVLWGENAPLFAGKTGTKVRKTLFNIAQENGYTMTTYRTKSLFHGVPQVRERSFYFFWKGDKVPLLNYFRKDLKTIEDTILDTPDLGQELDQPTNKRIPSENPYYQFLFEEILDNQTREDLIKGLNTPTGIFDIIESHTDYSIVGQWMKNNGYDREAKKCEYRYNKLSVGGNIMRGEMIFPKNYINAFVGQLPTILVHPIKDRYITYREALAIMGMPYDFELINHKRNLNHICQNVPVITAMDMAKEVNAVLNGEREYVNAKHIFQSNHKQQYERWDKEEYSTLDQFI
jgi:site-specific DNA-cytosine methylase